MISIGNDIVALSAINAHRTVDTRFHSKFITPTELELRQIPANGKISLVNFIWLLWSVKESAYKYQKRLNPDLVFSPGKISIKNVTIPDTLQAIDPVSDWFGKASEPHFIYGEVVIDNNVLYFKSIINQHFIASVVNNDPDFNYIYWGIKRITSSDHEVQSSSVREFLFEKLKGFDPQNKNNFTLQKDVAGYPVLYADKVKTGTLISLAHHGCYTSYAFMSFAPGGYHQQAGPSIISVFA